MSPKQVTPALVIVKAIRVGVLVWFGIFILRLLPYYEPAMVHALCRLLHLESYFALHGWCSSDQSWYGAALAAFHPAISLVAAGCSAILDLRELFRNPRNITKGSIGQLS